MFDVGRMGRLLLATVLAVGIAAQGPAVSAKVANPGPAQDPTPADPVREDGMLGLAALQLPRMGKICSGAAIPMLFGVSNVSPGLEIPLPVVEAGVSVADDQGKTRELLSNGAGLARFNWNTDRPGQIRFTVTARKTFYVDAKPLTFTVQVEPCQWAMSINYREEFAIISEVDMVVGAEVSWRGSVGITSTNGDSGTSEVEIRGGSGTYQFYASDKIKAPVHVSIDPPVSGVWDLRGDGSLVNGVLSLDVGTTEEPYPEMVFLKVTDSGPNNIQVKYKPPAPYLNGKGFFIEANKLSHMTFPTTGGAIELSSGLATYFWTDERTAYSLTILLYPLKDMGASLDGRLAFVGTVR
jgi:hypothetical protein